jgi:hypothetical protein
MYLCSVEGHMHTLVRHAQRLGRHLGKGIGHCWCRVSNMLAGAQIYLPSRSEIPRTRSKAAEMSEFWRRDMAHEELWRRRP